MARADSKVMILGGEPLDGKRYLYWNLVSSSRERIEKAKDDWKNDRFDRVPGETEFIPLPDWALWLRPKDESPEVHSLAAESGYTLIRSEAQASTGE